MNKITLFIIIPLTVLAFFNCHKKEERLPILFEETLNKSSEFFIPVSESKKMNKVLKIKISKPEENSFCAVSLDDKVVFTYDCSYNGVEYTKILPMNYYFTDELRYPYVLLLKHSGSEGCIPGNLTLMAFYFSGDYFLETIPNCGWLDEIKVKQEELILHFPQHMEEAGSSVQVETYTYDYKTKKLKVK